MENVLAFLRAAMPWISLGLLIGLAAGLCLHKKEKRHEK